MGWWHDHSVLVIEGLRAGRQPYDVTDLANTTDAINERTRREHLDDLPELTRREFNESFTRLLAALGPVTDDELFAADRWSWLGGEALVETILWRLLAPLRRASRAPRTAFALSCRKRSPLRSVMVIRTK